MESATADVYRGDACRGRYSDVFAGISNKTDNFAEQDGFSSAWETKPYPEVNRLEVQDLSRTC